MGLWGFGSFKVGLHSTGLRGFHILGFKGSAQKGSSRLHASICSAFVQECGEKRLMGRRRDCNCRFAKDVTAPNRMPSFQVKGIRGQSKFLGENQG